MVVETLGHRLRILGGFLRRLPLWLFIYCQDFGWVLQATAARHGVKPPLTHSLRRLPIDLRSIGQTLINTCMLEKPTDLWNIGVVWWPHVDFKRCTSKYLYRCYTNVAHVRVLATVIWVQGFFTRKLWEACTCFIWGWAPSEKPSIFQLI